MHSTRHIQRVYYLILSLFWLSTALPIALQVLLLQARGLDLFQIGLLMGIYGLTIVLLEVPTGGLADAVGRKQVAIIAYTFGAAASIVTLFAFSFILFLLVFILMGIGRALSSGALDAWFVDALQAADPDVDLQPALAKAGTVTLLTLGIGTLAGSMIPQLFHGLPADGAAVLTPLSMPILFANIVHVALPIATMLLVKEEVTAGRAGTWVEGARQVPSIVRSGFMLSRHNPTIMLLLCAAFATGLALLGLESFWQPFFAELMGGSEGNGLFFGIVMGGNFLLGMAGNMLATPLSRLLNKRYGLVAAVFQGTWGASIVLLAWQQAPTTATLFFWLAYMSMGVVNSPHSTLLNREIPPEHRSSMLSIASLASYAGSFLGGAGLGFIAQHTSISAAWIVSGMILMASLCMYWRVDVLHNRRRNQREAALEI